jgi:preprotein translocase subunit YajC
MLPLMIQSVPVPVSQTQAPPSGASGQAGQAQPPMGGLIMFMPLVLVAFLFFTNWRKGQKDKEVLKSLKKGDRVVSQSGLIGELVELEDRVAKVQISRGTVVQMLTSTLSPFAEVEAKSDVKKDAAVGLTEAKAAAEKK